MPGSGIGQDAPIEEEAKMDSPQTFQVKGTELRCLKEYVLEEQGVAAYDRWVSRLSPGAQELFAHDSAVIIQGSGWYEAQEVYLDALEIACELFHDGDVEKGGQEYGRFSADYGFTGAYRLLLRHGPAKAMLAQVGRVMGMYFKPGRAEVVEGSESATRIRFHECPPCRVFDYGNAGFIARTVELTGGTVTGLQINAMIADGDPYSEIEVHWVK